MVNYHGVFGIDERALNAFIAGVYDGARKTVFHGVIPVGHLGLGELESVEYDVATTPRAVLKPPVLSAGEKPGASLELWIDDMAVVLHYMDGLSSTTVNGAVRAGAALLADSHGSLVPQLTGVDVSLPAEP